MKRPGRKCALCNKDGGGCCTFLSLLMEWRVYDAASGKTNQFAHPGCVHKEQQRRKEVRRKERDARERERELPQDEQDVQDALWRARYGGAR
jgi:hypothetical protein